LKTFSQGTMLGQINLQHRKTVNYSGLDEISAIQLKFVLNVRNLQIFQRRKHGKFGGHSAKIRKRFDSGLHAGI
jgi:hypothetical protein